LDNNDTIDAGRGGFFRVPPLSYGHNDNKTNTEENEMKEVILSLVTGIVVGFLFTLFRLPIPAPPALAGIAGIVGVYLGMKVFEWVSYFWK
jgi:XapX domain-containing protein